MMTKPNLDFTAEIPHHEYDQVKITIQDYSSDGVTMRLQVDDGMKHSVTLTLEELENAVAIFKRYNDARDHLLRGPQ